MSCVDRAPARAHDPAPSPGTEPGHREGTMERNNGVATLSLKESDAGRVVALWCRERIAAAVTTVGGRSIPRPYVVDPLSPDGARVECTARDAPREVYVEARDRVVAAAAGAVEAVRAEHGGDLRCEVTAVSRVRRPRVAGGDPNTTGVVVEVTVADGPAWWVVVPLEPEHSPGRPRLPLRSRAACEGVDAAVAMLRGMGLGAAALRVDLTRFAAIGLAPAEAEELAAEAREVLTLRGVGADHQGLAVAVFAAVSQADTDALRRAVGEGGDVGAAWRAMGPAYGGAREVVCDPAG